MLTEADKKWLKERQDKGEYNFYYCQYCNKRPSLITAGLCAGTCLMYPGGAVWSDCAEFEAHIQKKLLLLWSGGKAKCPYKHCCAVFVAKKHWTDADRANVCGWCMQRFARLAVEAEMEEDGK